MRVMASALAAVLLVSAAPASAISAGLPQTGAASAVDSAAASSDPTVEPAAKKKTAARSSNVSQPAQASAQASPKPQTGRVLVIPAQPSLQTRVSNWLSGWRGPSSSSAARAAASTQVASAAQDDTQPTVKKKSRRSASTSRTRVASSKPRPVHVAERATKRSARKSRPQTEIAAKPAPEDAAQADDTASVDAAAAPAETADAQASPAATPGAAAPPAAAEPPSTLRTVLVEPAYAAPPQPVQVPPVRAVQTPLADLPAAMIIAPAQSAPRVGAPAVRPASAIEAATPPQAPTAVAPAEPQAVASLGPVPPATSRIEKQVDTTDEKQWWANEGQPVVFNFRDCVSAYAARESKAKPDVSVGELVLQASTGDCRSAFDDMMVVMTVRYGREKLEPMMAKLIEDTFLPAAREAVAQATHTALTQTTR